MNNLAWRPAGEVPTEPGWYWFREEGDTWITEVVQVGGGMWTADPDGRLYPLLDVQWAGPIPKPVELMEGVYIYTEGCKAHAVDGGKVA